MAKTQKLREKGEETLAAAKERSSEVAQRVEKGAKKAADTIKSTLPQRWDEEGGGEDGESNLPTDGEGRGDGPDS